jgi:DEAD/DEAH box helicase domain-containing protein
MYPGGTGIAEALHTNIQDIFAAALERIGSCPCKAGCPSCIGVESADKENKALAFELLRLLQDASAE